MKNVGSVLVDLEPAREEGFHTLNESSGFQRQHIRDDGNIKSTISIVRALHGLLSPGDDTGFCTILVLRFGFSSAAQKYRIREARIRLQFSSLESDEMNPAVLDFAPAAAVKMWGESSSDTASDAAVVVGAPYFMGTSSGDAQGVEYRLSESPVIKAGVPPSAFVAVRLKRQNEERFKATVDLEAVQDFGAQLVDNIRRSLFGRIAKADPIILDPQVEPTNADQTYDLENLMSVSLEKIIGDSNEQRGESSGYH